MSIYTAKIIWKSDAPDTFTRNRYTRGHEWRFDGGVTMPASSSPHVVRAPFSVEAAVDPEEALVASAASCHMLTFLWLAATRGFRIDAYEDNAEGVMEKLPDGRQWISRITLRPVIEWAGDKLPTSHEIDDLHHAAHEQCYIANSLRSEIVVELPKDAGSASA
jgi:organic hydroperoxide reductase OsmC/OhrA